MASSVTNGTAYDAATRFAAGKTFKLFLLTGTTTGWNVLATGQELGFLSALAADEENDPSYTRPTITGVTITQDNPNNRAEFTGANTTFASLTGDPVLGVGIAEWNTSAADSPVRGIIDVSALDPATRTPTGADFIVQPLTEGLLHFLTTP